MKRFFSFLFVISFFTSSLISEEVESLVLETPKVFFSPNFDDVNDTMIFKIKYIGSRKPVDWKIHIFIANDKKNNLYAILSDTNAGYDNIMKAVSNLNLENMLMLDSGGSSQLSVSGKIIVASQDDRAVPDYIVMK